MATLLTVGELARKLQQPAHRIDYIIKTRHIEPVGRAGGYRVFDDAACERIQAELAARREVFA